MALGMPSGSPTPSPPTSTGYLSQQNQGGGGGSPYAGNNTMRVGADTYTTQTPGSNPWTVGAGGQPTSALGIANQAVGGLREGVPGVTMPGLDPNIQGMSNWLRGQFASSNAGFNQLSNTSALQALGNKAYYGANAGYINNDYQSNLALNAQDQYRQVQLGLQSAGLDENYFNNMWGQQQQDIGNRTTTANNTIGIQNWLNQEQAGQNTQTRTLADWQAAQQRGLTNTQAGLTQGINTRAAQTAAIANGAMYSKGAGQNLADIQGAYGQALNQSAFQQSSAQKQAALDYAKAYSQTTASGLTNQNDYQAAINSLNNERNVGQNSYTHNIGGVNINIAGLNSLNQTYGTRAQQLGNQRNQAMNSNQQAAMNAAMQLQAQQEQYRQQQQAYNQQFGQYAFGLTGQAPTR